MTRFPIIPPEDFYYYQRTAVEAVAARRKASSSTPGGITGPFLRLLCVPGILDRLQMLGEHLRFDTGLSKKIRELAILITARHVGAPYEFHVHSIEAREFGISEEIIEAIAAKERPLLRDPEEELVYEFCTELLLEGRVSNEQFAKAEAQFGKAVVLELVATCGYYAAVGAVLNIAQVPPPQGVPEPFPAHDDTALG